MSDHRERSCTHCGSLLHHEDDCVSRRAYIIEREHQRIFGSVGLAFRLPYCLPGMPTYGVF